MKKTILFFTILFIGTSVFAQIDTTFWFAAPDVSSAFNYDRPVYLRISSFQQPCKITVSQPANGGLPAQTFLLAPNTMKTVDLTTWINSIECGPGNVIQNKGLKITSDNKIAVYYEVNGNGPNPELFALKGKNALGNQFYISSQTLMDNTASHVPTPTSSFNIVATDDNTSVTINPTKNIVGHSANIPFVITLNKGQTYAAMATSPLASQHLNGSFVSSDKPIAITLSDDLLKGTAFGGICEDLAGDQTVPVNVIGNEYIAQRSNLNSPFDKIYVMATANASVITQDGAYVTTLNAGQSVELSMNSNYTYIQTSSPAYAYQISGIGCEVGAAILPKINCTGSSSVSVARSTNESFIITLLVKNGGQNNFLLNNISGVITASDFHVVPGTGNQWYAAKITLPLSGYPNGAVVKITNSTHLFQLGILQGGVNSGTGVGYFSDFNTVQANSFAANPNPCLGSQIALFADTLVSGTYSWTGPNGYAASSQNPVINNASIVHNGDYVLKIDVPGCGSFLDTVKITVKPKSFSTINLTICQGQSYQGYSVSGTYLDTLISAGGCDSIRTLNLTVTQKLFSTVNKTICQGQSYAGRNTSGTYLDTLVNVAGCDSIRTINLTVKPGSISAIAQTICSGQVYLGHSISGIYIDTLNAINGCDSIRTLRLTVLPRSYSTITQSICYGQSYLGHSISGLFIDTLVAANGCDSIRTLDLSVNNVPTPNLGIDTELCTGQILRLTPGVFNSYLWQDGSTKDYYDANQPGLYSVTVTNSCGTASDNLSLIPANCDIYFPNSFTPNKDGKNETFHILGGYNLNEYKLSIYNRYGQKVFETQNQKSGWDGTINGVNADLGTYVWYCEFSKSGVKNRMKGSLVLIR